MPEQEHLPQSVKEITQILLDAKKQGVEALQSMASKVGGVVDVVPVVINLELSLLENWSNQYNSMYRQQKDTRYLDLMKHCYTGIGNVLSALSIEIREDMNTERLRQKKALNHSNLAYVYQEKGMPERALQEAQRAVRLGPSSPVTHMALAEIYAQQKQMELASREWQAALVYGQNDRTLIEKVAALQKEYHL